MKHEFNLYTRTKQLILDAVLFGLALTAAYLIRFEDLHSFNGVQFIVWLPIIVLTRLLVNWKRGVYELIWRFISVRDAIAIARSLSQVTIALLFLRLLYPGSTIGSKWIRLPLGIIALEFLL